MGWTFSAGQLGDGREGDRLPFIGQGRLNRPDAGPLGAHGPHPRDSFLLGFILDQEAGGPAFLVFPVLDPIAERDAPADVAAGIPQTRPVLCDPLGDPLALDETALPLT